MKTRNNSVAYPTDQGRNRYGERGTRISRMRLHSFRLQKACVAGLLACAALSSVCSQSSEYLQYECNPSSRECSRRMFDIRGAHVRVHTHRHTTHTRKRAYAHTTNAPRAHIAISLMRCAHVSVYYMINYTHTMHDTSNLSDGVFFCVCVS